MTRLFRTHGISRLCEALQDRNIKLEAEGETPISTKGHWTDMRACFPCSCPSCILGIDLVVDYAYSLIISIVQGHML